MKTKFITLFVLLGLFVHAQIITINDGVVVEDGDEFVFEEIDEEMLIVVTNDSSENIFTRIIVESIGNNENGTNLQLCYGGLCYSTIQEGASYPANGAVVITPGRTNNPNDHFINNYDGDQSNTPVTYSFKFVQVDTNENIIEGSEISFSYHYVGNLGVSDLDSTENQKLLRNSVVKENLILNSSEQGIVSIYNSKGQKVISKRVNGADIVNVASLVKGYYIVVFEGETGKLSQKFLKK